MSDKIKWMAAMGYIMVIADSFSAQLIEFYQFYMFGYYVNLVTLLPLIIYYKINKAHQEEFIANHLKRSIKIYYWYIAWSVFSGLFFESNNLWVQMVGVAVTWLMLFVLIYVATSCGKGIIQVFKEQSASDKKAMCAKT
ncbi:MAG: hypothetical protein GQ532_04845 [Methylomarinum sp.]|nr:hypothetical protein [Methylomarinum sp.]